MPGTGSAMQHFREEYECGHVRSQCRCATPGKRVIQLVGKCPACRAAQGEGQTVAQSTPPLPHGTEANPLGQRTLTVPAVAGVPSYDPDGDLPPVLIAFTTNVGTRVHVRMQPEDYESFVGAVERNTPIIRDDQLK